MRSAFLYIGLTILVAMAGLVVYAAWTSKPLSDPSLSVAVVGSTSVPPAASPDPLLGQIASSIQTIAARGTVAIVYTPTKTPPRPVMPTPTPVTLCSEAPRQSMLCDPRTPKPTDTPTPVPAAYTPIVPCMTVVAEVESGVRQFYPRECLSQWTPTP